jgi:hypothetical protein
MLPSRVPGEVRSDPKRSGEIEVYDRLKADRLLDGFLIMYSCEWVGLHEGLLRDGEADFVIAHPGIGFISVEVKGGLVSRRIADGKWTSRDRDGEVHTIQNPVTQAKKSKKIILAALLQRWGGRPPFLWARHGVILPHSYRPHNPVSLGAGMPLELFAFREDMENLGARVMTMLAWSKEGAKEKPGGLGPRGIKLLEDFYGRDIDFSPRLGSRIQEAESAIAELTSAQTRYLSFLSGARSAVIEGGAGTGKTTLAVSRARRAAAEGRSVLLLCFNRPLASHLVIELANSPASVATFHEFCGRICASTGIDLDRLRASVSQEDYWKIILPEKLAEIGLHEPPETYDDIIIDEGQDFHGSWVDALRLFLRVNGSMFVFRDDYQNVYGGVDAAAALMVTPMQLSENVRNTQQIFAVGSRFRQGPPQTCLGPPGPEVRWVPCDPKYLERAVETELNRLIEGERIRPEDVAVLTGRSIEAGCFSRAGKIGRHRATPSDVPIVGAVILDSVMRFKGLDRPVVILCDCEQDLPDRAYVGLTRAKSLLIVIGSPRALTLLGRPS